MYSDALDVNSDNNVLLCSVLKTIVLVLNVYCGIIERSLRKQPSFFAPGRVAFRETDATRPGAKKDGCFRRLH